MGFPSYIQTTSFECGPACLKSICIFYNKDYSIDYLLKHAMTTERGTNINSLARTAELIGFKTIIVAVSVGELKEVPLPSILYLNTGHYIVLYEITDDIVKVSDPSIGLANYSLPYFLHNWLHPLYNNDQGVVLLIQLP